MIEKIFTNLTKEERLKIKSKKSDSKLLKNKETFSVTLDDALKFDFKGTIDELMDELKEQEEKFLEIQSHYELSRYKAIVQKILKLIVDEGFSTKQLQRRRKDKADFLIIEKINRKLTDISIAVTRNNKAFNFLKSIEEIRGLIFDLRY